MLQSKLRVIIDTNLWVSYFITQSLRGMDDILTNDSIEVLLSEELIAEVSTTLHKSKFRKYLPESRIATIARKLPESGTVLYVTSEVKVCRDPNDNFLLALAKDGIAHYLITGDQDLLILKEFEGTHIRTISDFLSEIK